MVSKLLLALLSLAAFLLGGATARLEDHPKLHKVETDDDSIVAGSYFVVMGKGQTMENLSPMESHVQKTYTHLFPGKMVYLVEGVSDGEMTTMLDSPSIRAVYEDTYESVDDVESITSEEQWKDELIRQTDAPWGLDRIDTRPLSLDGNYDYEFDGTGVTIFIIDSGIRPTHQEFVGRFAGCMDFSGLGCDEFSGRFGRHGTHVAGTAAGRTYGVAKGARIYDLRSLIDGQSTPSSNTMNALEFAMSKKMADPAGKYVINMSLGGRRSEIRNMAIDNIVRQGIPVAAAAGNGNTDACTRSPASAQLAITVAASDITDARAIFNPQRPDSASNWGPCVDVFAPGKAILSAGHTGDTATATLQGTSMACPHVAGFAATLLQQDMDPNIVIPNLATPGLITDVRGSPNLLLFNGFGTPTPPPTAMPATTAPVPTTAAPATVVPTTPAPATAVPTTPAPTPSTCSTGESLFTLRLQTDFYGYETAWSLVNQCSNIIYSVNFDTYTESTEFVVDICITTGEQHKFAIFDQFGDGICCGLYGDGSYSISVDGVQVGSGGEFEFSEVTTFGGGPCPTPAPTTGTPTRSPTASPTRAPATATPTTALPTPTPPPTIFTPTVEYIYKNEAVFGFSRPVTDPTVAEIAELLRLTEIFYRRHISGSFSIPFQDVEVTVYNGRMDQLLESEVTLFESKAGSIGAFGFDGQLVDLALSRLDEEIVVLGNDQHQTVYRFRLSFTTRVIFSRDRGSTLPTKEEVGMRLANFDVDDYLDNFVNIAEGVFEFANTVIMLVYMLIS